MAEPTLQITPPVGGGNHTRRHRQLQTLHDLGVLDYTGTEQTGKRSIQRRYYITTHTGQRIALRGAEIDAFVLGYHLTAERYALKLDQNEEAPIKPVLGPIDNTIDDMVF